MRADVILLGAGIVGVSTALHLQMRGASVVMVDRDQPGEGTSFGNAGIIDRSGVIPFAFPRSLGLLAKYALNQSIPVRYDPGYLWKAAPFLFSYWRQSSPRNLKLAIEAMRPLVEASLDEHDALIEPAGAQDLVRANGYIGVWRNRAKLSAAVRNLEALRSFNLAYTVLDPDGLSRLEPNLRTGPGGAVGGIHWHDPKTVLDPGELVKRYASLFQRRGGSFLIGDAESLEPDPAGWSVTTSDGSAAHAKNVVIALGPQSGRIVRRFGYAVPLGIKRGYHRHYQNRDRLPRYTMVDEENGFVMAPMTRGLRITVGIEFADSAMPPDTTLIDKAEALARGFVPLGDRLESTPWLGLRPCLPDMQPIIGPAPRIDGLWFNFGHAHHGLTIGPATGRLLAEMMTGQTTFTDPAPYRVERFV